MMPVNEIASHEIAPQATALCDKPIQYLGFLTLSNFSMIAFSNAIEVLRMTNYVARTTHYRWAVVSVDGVPARASNGVTVTPTVTLEQAGMPDALIVCGGTHIREAVDAQVKTLLLKLAQREVPLGAMCTGAYALMRAGLLDDYRCAVHWEDMSALHQEFPRVKFANELFVIDRDRLTCTGGTAPLDLMLHLVTCRFGKKLAAQVCSQFMMERIRGASDDQPIPVDARIGFARAELIEVVRLMEANIEEPLSPEELARLAGVSQRHLQRMFKKTLNITPTHYYLSMRLRHARNLLCATDTSVAQISVMCGFQSACHFSKAYRFQFGYAPSHERRKNIGASR